MAVERLGLGACVGDEDVEAAELVAHAVQQAFDLCGLSHVGLNGEAVGAARAHLLQRGLRRRLVLHVVDRDVHAVIRELQRDAPADAARAAGHERVLGSDRHGLSSLRLQSPPRQAGGVTRRPECTRAGCRVFKRASSICRQSELRVWEAVAT